MRRVDSLEKTDAGRDSGQEEKGTTEDEMAGWHHWLDGRWVWVNSGVGDGQGGLACCDSWGHQESDTTERLNYELFQFWFYYFFKSLLNLLQYCFSILGFGFLVAYICRILVLWPRIESAPLTLKGKVLTIVSPGTAFIWSFWFL